MRDAARLLALDRASGATEHARFSDLPRLLAPRRPARPQRHRRAPGAALRPQAWNARPGRGPAARPAGRRALARARAGRRPARDRPGIRARDGSGDGGRRRRERGDPDRLRAFRRRRAGDSRGRLPAAAPVHPPAGGGGAPAPSKRSRPLPDGVRAAARVGRRADRRPALHRPALRAARARRGADGVRDARRRDRGRSARSAATTSPGTVLEAEHAEIPAETVAAIAAARARGGRVVAVGTTVTRTLETFADGRGGVLRAERARGPVHPARPPLPGDRRARHQLPPARSRACSCSPPPSPGGSACSRRTPRRSGWATVSTASATRC